MPLQNSITLDTTGNVIIEDETQGTISIQPDNPESMLTQLGRLNQTQLGSLLQVVEKQQNQFSNVFKALLNGIANEKNVVRGSISNVKTVRIGDETHYHYHYAATTLSKELTLSLPRIHPNEIIGRNEDLTELHTLLYDTKRVVLVNGLGGIGKTTLAQAYVSSYYDDYQHITWITQTSPNITTDFINTAGLIENLKVSIASQEPDRIADEIIRQLKGIPEKPNLLVIDNAEQSLKQYRDKLPGQPQWHVLLTSRSEISGFHQKTLGFLSEEQAIALFNKHYTHRHLTEAAIRTLVVMVDYHTLTIELLAKTAQEQRYNAGTLQRAIDENLRANVEVAHNRHNDPVERIGTYLRTVFALSNLSEPEIWLLKQLACLPPEFHTYEQLLELLIAESPPHADTFAETLAGITRKGWLLQNTATDSYKMHRIIADVVKQEQPISSTDVANLIDTITQKLSIDQTKDNPVDKFVWIPYGKALLGSLANETSAPLPVLQNNLATVLKDLGDYGGAKTLLEKALHSDEHNFGPDHPTTAVRYSNLALVLKDLGDYAEALVLSGKALAIFTKTLPPGHPHIDTVTSIYQFIQRAMPR